MEAPNAPNEAVVVIPASTLSVDSISNVPVMKYSSLTSMPSPMLIASVSATVSMASPEWSRRPSSGRTSAMIDAPGQTSRNSTDTMTRNGPPGAASVVTQSVSQPDAASSSSGHRGAIIGFLPDQA